MENLIISDLRTKEDLRFRLVSEIMAANFVGYMTVVRPIDGRFDSAEITLFLDYDASDKMRATIEMYEDEKVLFLEVAEGETTVQLLTRVRDRVTAEMVNAPNTEALCAEFLKTVNA